jgi:hypothetical protein
MASAEIYGTYLERIVANVLVVQRTIDSDVAGLLLDAEGVVEVAVDDAVGGERSFCVQVPGLHLDYLGAHVCVLGHLRPVLLDSNIYFLNTYFRHGYEYDQALMIRVSHTCASKYSVISAVKSEFLEILRIQVQQIRWPIRRKSKFRQQPLAGLAAQAGAESTERHD